MSKPTFDANGECPNCGKPATAMVLGAPQHEWVAWCENGHVTIGLLGSRHQTVFNFRNVEPS